MGRDIKFYRKNESEVMKKLGFRPTKNSGSGWIEKEDGENEYCLCQLKSTDKDSISIKLKDLLMLIHNSLVSHKIPIFAIQFLQSDDVWLLIRPQDLENVKDVARGEIIKNNVFFDFSIDTEQNTIYNKHEVAKRDIKNTIHSRKLYERRKQEEKEELHETIRKRRREKRKQ